MNKYSYFINLLKYTNQNIISYENEVLDISFTNKKYENLKKLYILYNEINKYKMHKINIISNLNNFVFNDNTFTKKNVNKNKVYINICDKNEIYYKIPEINYLLIDNDIVYFNNEYNTIISKLFKNKNFMFCDNKPENINVIEINNFELNVEIKDNYDFKPIYYLSGGLLGDFLNSLSVINEKFYNTGRKGIIYISNEGDKFTFGLEKAYMDTYNIIIKQIYIKDFKIYNNEIIDINLIEWRNFIKIPISNYQSFYNWKNIYSYTYNIEWANKKWLENIYYDEMWSNKVIINITKKRTPQNINTLINVIQNNKNIVFITFNQDEYKNAIEIFKNINYNFKDNVKLYILNSFEELVVIINSCKYAYLGISSFAVIANALHKEHSLFLCNETFGNFTNNLVNVLPHVKEFI